MGKLNDRYIRQVSLPEIGEEGQRRLSAASVLVVGCGALGSNNAETIARAGVGRIVLVDHDAVELSNLQRQALLSEEDIGRPKVKVVAERLGKINSQIEIGYEITHVDKENVELNKDCRRARRKRFPMRRAGKTIAIAVIVRSVTTACGPTPRSKESPPKRPRLAQQAVTAMTSRHPRCLFLIGGLLEARYNFTLSSFVGEKAHGEAQSARLQCLALCLWGAALREPRLITAFRRCVRALLSDARA
jgi:hypothetical protein